MSVHIANQIIKKEWTDYNNHMNMAYYVLVFDQIWEIMLEKFKLVNNSYIIPLIIPLCVNI